ncbi:MAG: hypothetical protein FWC19_10325 [Treponema sp.]|nr:hypothetical protein [Treponema sp.]
MPKEKPRGSDTPILAKKIFDGNIPADAILLFTQEATGLIHGTVTLTLHVKDGHLNRYVTNRECSIVPGRPMTGISN